MTTTSVLLVEDDVSLAGWIRDFLQSKGLQVFHLARGDQALAQWSELKPDVILLDLMLPGVNGLELCKQIRQCSDIPILMLTAQGEEFDEVLGLELGANDYLIKPIRPRVLLARINAVLRQNQTPPAANETNQLQFGLLNLSLRSHRVRFNGSDIPLTSNEFQLLWLLASRAGQIVSRQDVFLAMTGREYDGLDRRVDMMISSLRRKMQDDATAPVRIKTVWGKGYLFVTDAWNTP
ncbi:response regulator transcription factor [Alkalimonas amylolytica]|nr:response regulator transcription factor [Alkalimonas amylolytica]